MKQYFKTISKAGDPDDKGRELIKLIQWKIDRTPFWTEDESDTSSSRTEEESVDEEESLHESTEISLTERLTRSSSFSASTFRTQY